MDFLLGSPKVQKEVGALAGWCWEGVVVMDSRGSYLKACTLVVGDSVAAAASTISERVRVVLPWVGPSERAGTLAIGL